MASTTRVRIAGGPLTFQGEDDHKVDFLARIGTTSDAHNYRNGIGVSIRISELDFRMDPYRRRR
jgi:hypothetical protein